MKYYLGIDGGGSKTVGVLVNERFEKVSELQDIGSNPNDRGFLPSVQTVANVIRVLTQKVSRIEGVSIFAGIAGCGSCKKEFTAALQAEFPDYSVQVGTDADILLSAAMPEGNGCCIISGTGSVCYARKGGVIHRIGGWGYLLDRAGSGYDIGRDGLEAVLRAYDGRGEATLISSYMKSKLGAYAHEKLTEIYDGGRSFIASLAECVFLADKDGDMVAGDILYRNAYALYEYLECAYRILNAPFPCVIGGGIAENHREFTDLLCKLAMELPCEISVNRREAVYGAVELAKTR